MKELDFVSRSRLKYRVGMWWGSFHLRPVILLWVMAMGMIGMGSPFFPTLPAQAEQLPDSAAIQRASEPPSLRISRIRELIPNWQDQCAGFDGQDPVTAQQQALRQVMIELRKSDLGKWLIDQAAKRSVMVCFDDQTYLEAYYRAHLHLIGLNTKFDFAGRLVYLAHELAHVPQHPHFSNNRRFSPKDMLLLHRIREATAEAVATRVLWQLRDLGIDAAWQAKLDTAYGDIARRFELNIDRSRGDNAELQATRSAFHHWFQADWRLEIYDDLMLRTLTRIADDHIGILPPTKRLSDNYLREISSYAGDRFLEMGDGSALISNFGLDWSISDNRTKLDAILNHAHIGKTEEAEEISSIEKVGLSASSSRPIHIDPDQ